MPLEHTSEQLIGKAAKLLKLKSNQIKELQIVKKSIDARKKPELFIVYSLEVLVDNEQSVLKKVNDKNVMSTNKKKYEVFPTGTVKMEHRPVVIGAGPAGLFCAYLLAEKGYAPILLERGNA